MLLGQANTPGLSVRNTTKTFDHHVITIFVDGPNNRSEVICRVHVLYSNHKFRRLDIFQQIDTLFYRSLWSSHEWTISESCSFKIGAPALPGHWISVFRSAG